jgi:hypothetical protein
MYPNKIVVGIIGALGQFNATLNHEKDGVI